MAQNMGGLVKDINAGSGASLPRYITAVGDKVFFSTNDGSNGEELWVSDGTEYGTGLVKDINPGADNSRPDDLTAVGDKVFFSADDGSNGEELWVYSNDAPTGISVDNNRVDENATDGTVIATLSTADLDSSDFHTYTLLNDATGRFGISGDQIVVADGSLLNHESTDRHMIRVRTTDFGERSYEQDFQIIINDKNEAPEIENQTFSVAENATNTTVVGTNQQRCGWVSGDL
ncbi:MAG: ELWxxDGT repeat protein [Microcoleaceae cyanobacterium]